MSSSEQLLALGATAFPTLCVLFLSRERSPGPAAAFLALLSATLTIVWAYHKAPYEGPSIATVVAGHGLTVVDLVVPPSLAIEAAVLWRARHALRSLASHG